MGVGELRNEYLIPQPKCKYNSKFLNFTFWLSFFNCFVNFGIFKRPKEKAYMQLFSTLKKRDLRKLNKSLAEPPKYKCFSDLLKFAKGTEILNGDTL